MSIHIFTDFQLFNKMLLLSVDASTGVNVDPFRTMYFNIYDASNTCFQRFCQSDMHLRLSLTLGGSYERQ